MIASFYLSMEFIPLFLYHSYVVGL